MRPVASLALLGPLAALACSGSPRPIAPPAPPPNPAPATPTSAIPVASASLPVARTVAVVDPQFGLSVADPYRWMETEVDEVATWMRAHGAHAAAWFARLPGRERLASRVEELGMSTRVPSRLQLAGGRTFYMEVTAGAELPRLMVRDERGDRVLVDPTKLGGDSHAAIDNYKPSPDGALVAYNLSRGGGEISTVYVIEVETGTVRPDTIERIWGEFDVQWLPDGRGFFYTQMALPAAGVDPLLKMQVRLHVLGAPVTNDVAILGAGVGTLTLAPQEFPVVWVPPGSRTAVATSIGARSEIRVAVAPLAALDRTGTGKTPWREVARFADGVEELAVHGDRMYLLTHRAAPNRKVVSVPLGRPDLKRARLEVAEDREVTLVGMEVAKDALYVRQMIAGSGRVLRRPWKGKAAQTTLPYSGWVSSLATDPDRAGAVIGHVGWTRPEAYLQYDGRGGFTANGLAATSAADYSGIVAEELEVESDQGVRVPLSILRRSDLVLDGSHPTVVNGYGGYGISINPSFNPTRLAWLERGGVLAFCHVRGGGEKGHQWQLDGARAKKLDGVRDLIACGEYLIAKGYTARERLVVEGRSAGGILIGRAVTLRPELFAAAVIGVGMVNPLRMLAADNGANQMAELGDPGTAEGYRWLEAMDPYVHVTPDTAYPAVLFAVGLNDKRVAPWMSAKMAARLLASSTSGRPILVRTESDAGHGVGSTRGQALAERADIFSFSLAVTGDPEFQAP